jgi:DNA repair photolyase
MTISEVEAKSVLNKHKRIDPWFISRYSLNVYRGCGHACAYCDGRAEAYRVEGSFGEDITVKVNVVEVLKRELDPKRKRIPLKRTFILLGGGVGDVYQNVEEKYKLTRGVLEVIGEYDFPVHILTKSNLVERDLDILKRINKHQRVIVSMSFSSVNDKESAVFEPKTTRPSERLRLLARLKKEGFATGLYLLPVIPFITDTVEKIEGVVRKAKEARIDFILFGGMTLKEGKQKSHFMDVLRNHRPELLMDYENLYPGNKWGDAKREYYECISKIFYQIAKRYKVPIRIPQALFKDMIDENDLVTVVLENIDYLLRLEGHESPFRYSARTISQLNEPLSGMKSRLLKIKGVGKITEKIIREVIDTGTSTYLESLLYQ